MFLLIVDNIGTQSQISNRNGLNENSFKDYYFNQTPVQSFCVQRKRSNLYISIKDWFQQLVSF